MRSGFVFSVLAAMVLSWGAALPAALGQAGPGGAAAGAQPDWRYMLSVHDVARADDDERLAQLLKDNPDRAKLRLADGRTPVHVAAEAGAVKSLRALAKAGADMNLADNAGRTPLAIAVGLDFATTVKVLLESGAEVNREGLAEGTSGEVARTPLVIAARRGYGEVLTILLDAKADVNRPGSEGVPPLVAAATTKHWDILKTLLDHNANANVQDNAGQTALLLATQAGEVKTVELLLSRGADPRLVDKKGQAPLSVTRDPALWKMLVAKGADVNVVVGGVTPLQYFIVEGNAGLVDAWLEFKPDPMVTDRKGLTAKELARKYASSDGTPARKEIARTVEDYQKKFVAAMEPKN